MLFQNFRVDGLERAQSNVQSNFADIAATRADLLQRFRRKVRPGGGRRHGPRVA